MLFLKELEIINEELRDLRRNERGDHGMKKPKPSNIIKDGMKSDLGKPRFDHMSPTSIGAGNRAHDYGDKKYQRGNWRKGIEYSRILNALIRHTMARLQGEVKDPESGLLHTDHIMANANMICHYENTKGYEEYDDTEKLPTVIRRKRNS